MPLDPCLGFQAETGKLPPTGLVKPWVPSTVVVLCRNHQSIEALGRVGILSRSCQSTLLLVGGDSFEQKPPKPSHRVHLP